MYDGFVKSLKKENFVIPAQAGIQYFQMVRIPWIPVPHFHEDKFHGNDDFLRLHHV